MIDTLDLVKRQLSFSNAELSVICLSVCPSRLMGGGGGGVSISMSERSNFETICSKTIQ